MKEPRAPEERRKTASTCGAALEAKFPILVDDMANTAERAYAAWPERYYVIGRDGRVACKSKPGSANFKAADLAAQIEKLRTER